MQYVLVFVIGVSVQRPTENTKQQDYHPMDSGAKNTPVAKEPTRQQQPSQFYTLILHKEKQKLKLSGNKVVMPEHKTKVMQLKSRTCFVPILVAHTGAYPGAKETSSVARLLFLLHTTATTSATPIIVVKHGTCPIYAKCAMLINSKKRPEIEPRIKTKQEKQRALHAFNVRTSLSGEVRLVALGITWWQQPGEH